MDGAEDSEVERDKAGDVNGAEDDEDELLKLKIFMEPKMLKWKEVKLNVWMEPKIMKRNR